MSSLMALGYDLFMRASEEACLQAWRHELLADLDGDVLEIGAGTGANLAHYPATARLTLLDDDRHMLSKLRERVGRRGIEVVRASAEDLPFESARFDAVVSTLVLCSVPDVARVLAEVRRVLRPGGRLVFIEHVAATDNASRLRWQRRIEPLWKHLAGNCHLTRDTAAAIRAAGFHLEDERHASMQKALPIVRPTIRGSAWVGSG